MTIPGGGATLEHTYEYYVCIIFIYIIHTRIHISNLTRPCMGKATSKPTSSQPRRRGSGEGPWVPGLQLDVGEEPRQLVCIYVMVQMYAIYNCETV